MFLILEALIAGGRKSGLSAEQARQLALGTLAGARGWPANPTSRPQLRERVTSKGGTTAAALAVFQQAGLAGIIEQGMQAAARRSRELAEEFGK
ncbi:pyrroline-5-carboxylate reductase family protein [Achromobacter sp. DMS1]|uniref:pyrroline-5-carboxylate reductase family protein n=1 Tax=Achromobacter sp. DMS1 TaxID=1688405 RepID=UPI000AC08878